MRVYLPATLPSLAAAVRAGSFVPAPITAYAVTPALRESYGEGDEEELEYVALTAAARGSLRLLAADPGAPRRRVVVAADVPDGSVVATGSVWSDPAAVRIGEAVPLPAVASAHVDDDEAGPDVAAAVKAVAAADAGDEDAAFSVDGAESHELAWFAFQEISDLTGL